MVETTSNTPCDGFAIVFTFNDVMPPSRSLYYLRFVFLVVSARLSSRHAINNISARASDVLQRRVCCTMRHYAEPFHATLHCLHVRCTILHHAEPFHAMLHICVYAVPFDITLTHVTQGYTVCVYAVPFDISLSHFTQRYTICVYAIPFYITLSKLTQCYTVCAYAVLLDITLSHFTQWYAV